MGHRLSTTVEARDAKVQLNEIYIPPSESERGRFGFQLSFMTEDSEDLVYELQQQLPVAVELIDYNQETIIFVSIAEKGLKSALEKAEIQYSIV